MSEEKSDINEVPGSVNGMFIGYFRFDPTTTFELDDLITILKAMDIRFGPEEFEKLPEKTKKQFSVYTREGKSFRYGQDHRRW